MDILLVETGIIPYKNGKACPNTSPSKPRGLSMADGIFSLHKTKKAAPPAACRLTKREFHPTQDYQSHMDPASTSPAW